MKWRRLILLFSALFFLWGLTCQAKCPPWSGPPLSPPAPPPQPSPSPTPSPSPIPIPAPSPEPPRIPICGDGHITPPEECDPSANPTGCKGDTSCDKNCRCVKIQITPVCGDGYITPPEECDPYWPVSYCGCKSDERCDKNCKCIKVQITPQCGDSLITPPEQCDPKSQLSNYGCGPNEICSGCKCLIAPPTVEPVICGDKKVSGNEQCDPTARPTGCKDDERCNQNCKCIKVQITPIIEDDACSPPGGNSTSDCQCPPGYICNPDSLEADQMGCVPE